MKRNYNILAEADTIASHYEPPKPDFIDIPDRTWQLATPKSQTLAVRIAQLEKPLEQAYYEAIRREDYKQALITYQGLVVKPHLPSNIDPELWDKKECLEAETKFHAEAIEWITETERLLYNGTTIA